MAARSNSKESATENRPQEIVRVKR